MVDNETKVETPAEPDRSNMTFAVAVQLMRTREDVESVLVLTGKHVVADTLRKVALAWPKVPLKTPGRRTRFSDGPHLWHSMWDGVGPDYEGLQRVTGMNCIPHVQTLVGYRLIYPDGTLATMTVKALRALAKSALGM